MGKLKTVQSILDLNLTLENKLKTNRKLKQFHCCNEKMEDKD